MAQGTKTIEFEGQTHEFPADFSDDDISRALKSLPAKDQADPGGVSAGPVNSPGVIGAALDTAKAFGKRAKDTVVGGYRAITAPPQVDDPMETVADKSVPYVGLPAYRIGKGLVQAEKTGAQQVGEYDRASKEALKSGSYKDYLLRQAQAATTVGAMANPLATGTVTDINKLEDQGRNREAIGTGAFDALMLLVGKALKNKAPATADETMVNKLTAAAGEDPKMVDLPKVLNRIKQTVATSGKQPGTIGELQDVVHQTERGIEKEFQADLGQIAKRPVPVQSIVDLNKKLDGLAQPNWRLTPEGLVKRRALAAFKRKYLKPMTYEEINAERSDLRDALRSPFYNKPGGSATQSAALADIEVKMQKVAADHFSNEVNTELGRATGKGADYYSGIRRQQKSLIDIDDHLKKQADKLTVQERGHEGTGPLEKIKGHVAVSHRGLPRAAVTGLADTVGEGPGAAANKKVASAFAKPGVTRQVARGVGRVAKTLTKAEVRALPVGHLSQFGDEDTGSKPGLPPPPQYVNREP